MSDAILGRVESLERAICKAVDAARPYADEFGVVEISIHPFGSLARIRQEVRAREALLKSEAKA